MGQGEGCRGCTPLPPEMTCGFLKISSILQEQKNETRLKLFLSGVLPPNKNPGPAPGWVISLCLIIDLAFFDILQGLFRLAGSAAKIRKLIVSYNHYYLSQLFFFFNFLR